MGKAKRNGIERKEKKAEARREMRISQELVRECLYKGRFIHFHTNNEVHFAGINPDDKLS